MKYLIDILHDFSSNHISLLKNNKCKCFYCLKSFHSNEIEEWIDKEETALCPYCGIDSVLPESINITEEILKEMNKYWFGRK
jgi:NAD-dependent SIR2 family protein deacetylase